MLPRLSQFEPSVIKLGGLKSRKQTKNTDARELNLRRPCAEDGIVVHELISRCPPLDQNSIYCNLIQCTHFAETCVLAEKAGALVGFVSAYRKPEQLQVLFVWQIAVDPSCRGQGLAGRMLDELLARPDLQNIRYLETTVTPANKASAALFRKLAQKCAAPLTHSKLFTRSQHFAGRHDDETLFRIGPIAATVGS